MICPIPNDPVKPSEARPPYVKISKKIKKIKEKSKAYSQSNSYLLSSSKTILRGNKQETKTYSVHKEITPLEDIKEEISYQEEENSIFNENNRKNQAKINVAYMNETLASYLKKEVFFDFFYFFLSDFFY